MFVFDQVSQELWCWNMNKEQESSSAESSNQLSFRQVSKLESHIFTEEVAIAINQIALELQKFNTKPELDLLALSGLVISLSLSERAEHIFPYTSDLDSKKMEGPFYAESVRAV